MRVASAGSARGAEVHLETRPIYLLFTSERFADADGALYVGNPPLREADDVDALWAGLAAGVIDTVASDHAPWSRAEKLAPDRTIATFRPGMPDLETMLPLLYSEGVRTGRLSVERFVAVTSSNAARLFGLYPTKGTIRVGSDADLVVWDPSHARTVTAAGGQSRADFSLYEGRVVTGWPAWTMCRGRVLVADGRLVEDAAGGRPAVRHRPPGRAG